MRKLWLLFSQAVTVALAVVFVITTLKPQWLSGLGDTVIAPGVAPPPAASSLPAASAAAHPGFSEAARVAAPAVVSILTSKSTSRQRRSEPWFRFFFGGRNGTSRQLSGVGSGVIITPDGYVLTNNHVIAQMDDIEVMLTDGRKARALVIGTDPETDLAVLKINLAPLPVIAFGDSASLEVGDVVLAIGNPFGVGQTVTSGIVSALGRNQLGINTFENFIQTDAAINPGNSGGALVDAHGLLMGINTAIYSRSGGNMGIGFAIPASTARQVMESLIRDGRVTRGWIGVEPRDLTPDIAQTLSVPTSRGVLITGVLQGGPAAAGGMRPGDVVTRVAGHEVENTAQLLSEVAALRPQSAASISVLRADQQLEIQVRVGERPRAQHRQHITPPDDEE